MSPETARKSIDWIFDNVPHNMTAVEVQFIGGEPLLEFELIKEIIEYTNSKNVRHKYIFFATTNGTLLTDQMKQWFIKNKNKFYLGLSLDGAKETHNHNRSNSFDDIDIDFFKNTWPDQGVKMTLSDFSLHNLANDIKFIHSIGFRDIGGVNLYEGDFDWNKDEYIKVLIPQLKELVKYYIDNDHLPLNQMFDKNLYICEAKNKERKKWCGIGDGTRFFDVDGKMYPCYFITPMTFSCNEIERIVKIDFTNEENFMDDECFYSCYIYPICPSCSGANYLVNNTFKKRIKSKCRIQKLIALFIADILARKIRKNPTMLDGNDLYYTIEAIKNIKKLYIGEFIDLLQ
jgi:radical SAM protein with 4Fe4S-binding SPASM domain